MKFRSVTFVDHYLFGNLHLSFVDPETDKAYDSIIIAGENGSGKSTLLESLFIPLFAPAKIKTGGIQYSVEFNDDEFTKINSVVGNRLVQGIKCLNIKKDFSKTGWDQTSCIFVDLAGREWPARTSDLNGFADNELRFLYSDVDINFEPGLISNVTSMELDNPGFKKVKSNSDLAKQITQLLVDVSHSDASDLLEYVKNHPGEAVPPERVSPKMDRFTQAFEQMFPNKRFVKIDTQENRKIVLFSENDKTVPLDKFSSGEKQIVFRGAFLLRDKQLNDGAIVSIDEPEISLHPRWQLKILNFYKSLFTNAKGEQSSQLFIVTHSPFIIHNDNRYNDIVIVLERNANGIVESKETSFFQWGKEAVVEGAFKIDLSRHVVNNIVYVEGQLDELYFNTTIGLFNRQVPFEVKWIGRETVKGKAEFTGESSLDQMRKIFEIHPHLLTSKAILYYDNDCKVELATVGNLMVRQAPSDFQNKHFMIGIESLLKVPDDFDAAQFYRNKTQNILKRIEEFDKTAFANWILKHDDAKKCLTKINDLLTDLEAEFLN